jgi:hypothetical protein
VSRHKGIVFLALAITTLAIATVTPSVYGWGTKHGDNDPSTNVQKYCSETLKECAKNIDDMKYKDRSMNWDHFKALPAFKTADEDEKFCLVWSHDDGHGADGLASYEVLACYKDPTGYVDE